MGHVLFIDSRESLTVQTVVAQTIGKGNSHVTKLDCADFLTLDPCMPAHAYAVERKTTNDFLVSLKDGRISRQLKNMLALYSHPILLIEGTMVMSRPGQVVQKLRRDGERETIITNGGKVMRGNSETGWSHAATQMLLLALQEKYPTLGVLFTNGRAETADIIRVLHQRTREGCISRVSHTGSGDEAPQLAESDM